MHAMRICIEGPETLSAKIGYIVLNHSKRAKKRRLPLWILCWQAMWCWVVVVFALLHINIVHLAEVSSHTPVKCLMRENNTRVQPHYYVAIVVELDSLSIRYSVYYNFKKDSTMDVLVVGPFLPLKHIENGDRLNTKQLGKLGCK